LLGFLNRDQARDYFEKLEKLLENQAHYWVQRASVEAEEGDLDLAKSQIELAFGINPNDILVITTQAYIDIKRAIKTPTDSGLEQRGKKAFDTLFEIVNSNREKDVHPYHIIGSQGLAWSRRFIFPDETERKKWLKSLLEYVKKGELCYPTSTELQQLKSDLNKERFL
jgi:tetratricopeptide (TPR) repeat protein